MAKLNIIGVDLAKNVIQAAVVSTSAKVLINTEFYRKKFAEFLAKQPVSLVAFEVCSSAHYWARQAKKFGHEAKVIPAKAVVAYRQGHKTDRNDAVAVAEAANRPTIKQAPIKSIDQQGLQAIQRSRDLLMKDRTAHSNHMRGLLMEFGIYIPKGMSYLRSAIPEILEDGENELSDMYRATQKKKCLRPLNGTRRRWTDWSNSTVRDVGYWRGIPKRERIFGIHWINTQAAQQWWENELYYRQVKMPIQYLSGVADEYWVGDSYNKCDYYFLYRYLLQR